MRVLNQIIILFLAQILSSNSEIFNIGIDNKTDVDSFTCPVANAHAKNAVKFFLTAPEEDMQSFRQESGTTAVAMSEITLVNDGTVCAKLNELIDSDSGLQEDLTKYDKCFYQSDNFYFIIYPSKELLLGFTSFIVVNKDFEVTGIYGI